MKLVHCDFSYQNPNLLCLTVYNKVFVGNKWIIILLTPDT